MFNYFFGESKELKFDYDKYYNIIFDEYLYDLEWLFGQDIYGKYKDFNDIKEQNRYQSIKNKIKKLNEIYKKYTDGILKELDLVIFEIRLLEPYYLYDYDKKLNNCYDENSIYKFYNVLLNCDRHKLETSVEYLIKEYNLVVYNNDKDNITIKNGIDDAIELKIEGNFIKEKYNENYNWKILDLLK